VQFLPTHTHRQCPDRLSARNLTKAGWNCVCISSTDHKGRQFGGAAAEREDAGRFIVHADEMVTAFLELQAAIRRQLELG
jgi:hypothetical protein